MSDLPRRLGLLGLLLVALALPLVLEDFWLQLGLFVMATAIGAVGLTLLVGVARSCPRPPALAAIGAYVYVWATAECPPTRSPGRQVVAGVVGLVLAVSGGRVRGFVFSRVAARLRGHLPGLATLGLVLVVRRLY